MDPVFIPLISAAIGVLVGYVAPKLAKRTATKVDDKIVKYARDHLPEIVEWATEQVAARAKPAARPGARDHRGV